MKKIAIICFFSLISVSVFSNDKILKICLTGSTEKAIPNYGEAFFNGAKLALSELDIAKKKKVEIIYNPYDTTPLAAVDKLKELRNDACDAIVGFSTGNDLLSIEDSLKKSPVLTLSIYGDPRPHFTKTNYLRTLQPSAEELTAHLLGKVNIKAGKKVLMITAIDRSEMTSYREAFLSYLSHKNITLKQVEVLEQANDLTPLKRLLEKDKDWNYAILLARSSVAAEVSDLIHQFTHPILLGTKYMGSAELPAFFNYLKNKNVEAYFSRQNCTCSHRQEYKDAVKKYVAKFGIKPMAISIDTYDTVKFIFQAIDLPHISSLSVIQFLNSKKASFKGSSSLVVLEGLKLKVTDRFLMKITEKGYAEVK
jgi:hypothetical protein